MKIFLLLLSLCICSITNATIFYISTTGNDNTGNGTIGNPYRTIFKGLNVAVSGDIIEVGAGTFNENTQLVLPVGVSIHGVSSAATIIKSTITYGPLLIGYSAEGTAGNNTISNLQMDGQYSNGNPNVSQGGTRRAMEFKGRGNIVIHDCLIRKFGETGIFIIGGIDFIQDGAPSVYASGIQFYNNVMDDNAPYNVEGFEFGRGNLSIGGTVGALIHDNTITQNGRAVGNNGWCIKAIGNGGYNKGLKIYNNTFNKIPFAGNYGGDGGWDFAVEIWHADGLEVYDNTFVGGGLDVVYSRKGGYAFSSKILRNTFYNTTLSSKIETAMILEYGFDGLEVADNIIYNKTIGIVFYNNYFGNQGETNYQPFKDINIHNNLMYNVGQNLGRDNNAGYGINIQTASSSRTITVSGGNGTINVGDYLNSNNGGEARVAAISGSNLILGDIGNLGAWLTAASISDNTTGATRNITNIDITRINLDMANVYINNNTIKAATGNAPFFGIGLNIGTEDGEPTCTATSTVTNFNIQNNVVQGFSSAWFASEWTGSPGLTFTGCNIKNNNLYLNGNSNSIYQGWTNPTSYVNSGNLLESNPNLDGSYHPTGAPLVDGGINVGLAFNGSAPDIGFYEVGGTAVIPPTANAGPDQTITLPTTTTTLLGSGTDADGTIAAYHWTKIAGPAAGAITNASASTTTVTALVLGIYQFELKVTDNNGAVGKDTVQVTVNPNPFNIVPTANAGADQTITLPTNTITVTGSGTDPDGTITTYLWSKIAGPNSGSITNANTASTTITALTQGVYQFELRVTDDNGSFGRDTVMITVNPDPNIAPTANAGADQTITLPTNSGTLTGSGTDADGTIAAYHWTKIAGPNAGTITNTASAITTVTGLVSGIYKFELRVTDNNGAFGRDTVMITVNPDPNIAPIANAGADQTITFPTNTITLTGSGTDADGTIAAYHWAKIAGPNAGTITNAASATTTVTGLVGGIYKFELTVTDNKGAVGRDNMQLIVYVPNIPPTANAGLNQSLTLPTNTIALNGSGTDVDGNIVAYLWTKLAGPTGGVITSPTAARTTITGLTVGVYYFGLRVTDNNGAFGSDTVQINVSPENIAPTAHAGADQTITLPSTKITLTGSGTDIDGTIVSYAWKQIAGPADKLTSLYTPVTAIVDMIEGSYKFELTVTDNKGAKGKDTVGVIVEPLKASTPLNTIKVYPNPVVDMATLEIHKDNVNATMLVVITDMQGKIVLQKQVVPAAVITRQPLDFTRLSKGAYLVTVYFSASEKQTEKIIKL